jgi:CubicO group peptidase (beta-lactamase class C family)
VIHLLFHACVVLLLVSPAFAADGDGAILPARDLTELQERLGRILKEANTPGMGVVIANRAGIVWSAGIGLADVAAAKPATSTTLFRIASVSKTFVALAVLKLVEEGKLSLDAPVKGLVPEVAFANPWEAEDPVRVAHLLEHTTGWDDIHPKEFAHNDPKPMTLAQGLAIGPESRTSRWRPGTRFSYSNAGPAVAAAIVEKLTGKRFEDYVKETFFDPLGMSTADYFYSPQTRALLTKLYRADGKTPYDYQHIALRPSGALNASAEDMGHALRFLLRRGQSDRGRILGEVSIQRMETSVTSYGAQGGLQDGYGLCNEGLHDRRMRVWRGHSGSIHGALSEFYYLPEQGVGYFFSINAHNGKASWAIANQLTAYLTKDLPLPSPPPAASVPVDVAEAYSGWYRPANPRLEALAFQVRILGLIHMTIHKAGLVIQPLHGSSGHYVAVDGTHFRYEKLSAANLVLMSTPDGRMAVTNRVVFMKIGTFQAWATIVAAVLFLLAIASVPLFASVWGIRWIFRRMRGVPMLHVRVLPLLAWLSVVAALALAQQAQSPADDTVMRFSHATVWSVAIQLSTLAFAMASTASLLACLRAWKRRKEMNAVAYYHSFAVAIMFVIATLYLARFGVIGYRTWA